MTRKNTRTGYGKVVFLALLIIAAVVFGLWWHKAHTALQTASSSNGINMTPLPAQDRPDTKKTLTQAPSSTPGSGGSSSQSGTSTSGKQQVSPVISTHSTSTTTLTVNGYVQGVVEQGGTCTLQLVNGSQTVSRSKPGVLNATNTSCGRFDIPLSDLSPGTWQATLSYSSSTSEGTSAPQPIIISQS